MVARAGQSFGSQLCTHQGQQCDPGPIPSLSNTGDDRPGRLLRALNEVIHANTPGIVPEQIYSTSVPLAPSHTVTYVIWPFHISSKLLTLQIILYVRVTSLYRLKHTLTAVE